MSADVCTYWDCRNTGPTGPDRFFTFQDRKHTLLENRELRQLLPFGSYALITTRISLTLYSFFRYAIYRISARGLGLLPSTVAHSRP